MNSKQLQNRCKTFAHDCVKVSSTLKHCSLSQHISKQLIRSSTSVAANYRAACLGQSRASFRSKISIVLEEVDESLFWLEFIRDEKLIDMSLLINIINEADELKAIFYSTRKSL